jgi:hypothetical protein
MNSSTRASLALAPEQSRLLRENLDAFDMWLCEQLSLVAIEFRVWQDGPLAAAYRWRGEITDERFLLSLKFTPEALKILHLWLPRSKRNRGIGSAILRQLQLICSRHQIPTILVEPRPGSERFWKRTGFAPLQSERDTWVLNLTHTTCPGQRRTRRPRSGVHPVHVMRCHHIEAAGSRGKSGSPATVTPSA